MSNNNTIELHTVHTFVNECCLCLELIELNVDNVECILNCCRINIHDTCLLRLVLHDYKQCPLCRKSFTLTSIYNSEYEFTKIYNKLNQYEQELYRTKYKTIQHIFVSGIDNANDNTDNTYTNLIFDNIPTLFRRRTAYIYLIIAIIYIIILSLLDITHDEIGIGNSRFRFQYTDWNTQYADWNTQYVDWNTQYVDWNTQYTDWNTQYADWNTSNTSNIPNTSNTSNTSNISISTSTKFKENENK